MIVVMKPGASQRQVDHVIERIEQLGLRSHVIVGTERTVIAAFEKRRRIGHRRIEPQLVEVIRYIVVKCDCALITLR